jgi:endonuclease YncB( thermonuclease family)
MGKGMHEKKQNIIKLLLVVNVVFLLLTPAFLFGHSGGLNSSGCHTNHKTGDYHCHGGGSSSGGSGSGQSRGYSGGMEVIPEARQAPKKEQSVRVVGVTDGDTLNVLIEGQEVKIRLYGIDAPESGQAFGKASQQALKQITSGR